MPSERDKASENPYGSPQTTDDTTGNAPRSWWWFDVMGAFAVGHLVRKNFDGEMRLVVGVGAFFIGRMVRKLYRASSNK